MVFQRSVQYRKTGHFSSKRLRQPSWKAKGQPVERLRELQMPWLCPIKAIFEERMDELAIGEKFGFQNCVTVFILEIKIVEW